MLSCVISVTFMMLIKTDNAETIVEKTACAQEAESDTDATAQTSSLNPDEVFRRARLAYNSQVVVAASMREETLVYDRHFIGAGKYMEKIENAKRYLRMEMNYSCDNNQYTVQYISDASKDMFWISKSIGSNNELNYVNSFNLNAQSANPEKVASIDGVPISPVSLAGIPFILFQIEKHYAFSSCSMIQDSQSNEQYYVVVGKWKPEQFPIQSYVSDNVIKWNDVPPEIPDTIKVYFGSNDLFPYRIYYYRDVKGKQTLISKLNFYDVSFDVRLNIKQFSFSPSGNFMSDDITDQYSLPEETEKETETETEDNN